MTTPGMGSLCVRRERDGAGVVWAWTIDVDGVEVGKVRSGATLDVAVEPGRHRLVVRNGRRHRSGDVLFEIERGGTIDLSVRRQTGASGALGARFPLTIDSHETNDGARVLEW